MAALLELEISHFSKPDENDDGGCERSLSVRASSSVTTRRPRVVLWSLVVWAMFWLAVTVHGLRMECRGNEPCHEWDLFVVPALLITGFAPLLWFIGVRAIGRRIGSR